MSGDIGNAFERLRRLLAKIKYHGRMDQAMAMAGAPEILLPLLHYIILAYSRDVAKFVSNAGYELMGRSDMQFVSDCFRLLSDLFAYHPSVSSKQFLTRGFAQRKLNMMSDVILLVLEKKKRLAPVPHSSSHRRSMLQPVSVVRTVAGNSDTESSPSPRISAPPAPTAKLPLQSSDASLDMVAKLSGSIAALDAALHSLNDSVAARFTILEGKIHYIETKLKSQEPVDREEREKRQEQQDRIVSVDKQNPTESDRSRASTEPYVNAGCVLVRLQNPFLSYAGQDHSDTATRSHIPTTFADRMNSSGSGESLTNAFSVLSQTPDSTFVQNLLARVEQTDILLAAQFHPLDSHDHRDPGS